MELVLVAAQMKHKPLPNFQYSCSAQNHYSGIPPKVWTITGTGTIDQGGWCLVNKLWILFKGRKTCVGLNLNCESLPYQWIRLSCWSAQLIRRDIQQTCELQDRARFLFGHCIWFPPFSCQEQWQSSDQEFANPNICAIHNVTNFGSLVRADSKLLN